MLKRVVLAVLTVMILYGCPDPQTGKVDPYLTARTIINQANTALSLTDGIFNQWALVQTDKEKSKKVAAKYHQIRTAVANGLQLALDGVNIAQQAKEDPDVRKLLLHADEAWKDLHTLLADLLYSNDASIVVNLKGADASRTSEGGVAYARSSLRARSSPVDCLPDTLLPSE